MDVNGTSTQTEKMGRDIQNTADTDMWLFPPYFLLKHLPYLTNFPLLFLPLSFVIANP